MVARTSSMHILRFRGQLQDLCSGSVCLSFMTRVRAAGRANCRHTSSYLSPGCWYALLRLQGLTTGAHVAVEAEDGNQVDGKHVHNWRLILSIWILVGVKRGLGRYSTLVVVVRLLSHVWLCDLKDCSMPGFPVLHYLPEFTQTHVRDTIQPSLPLLPPSPPALNHSQHQGLLQWVSSLHQVAKILELQLQHQSFQWIFRVDFP